MWQTVMAGGWIMLPILLCSALALTIGIERIWALRRTQVIPPTLVSRIPELARAGELAPAQLQKLRKNSALGRVLAAALGSRSDAWAVKREHIEEAGRHVVHNMERYLNTLGTIAAITPLLGLLGTVIGMIKVFAAITASGVGDPQALSGGISEALLTTAAGLSVAIPSLILYRYLRGHIDELVVGMETHAIQLLEMLGAAETGNDPQQ